MSNLLNKYEDSDRDSVVRARKQAEGGNTVNHFDLKSEFSENFTARKPSDKTIQLSNDPNETSGNFTDYAREYYNAELNDIQNERFKKYTREKTYIDENGDEIGVNYSFSPSE